ncbi:MAG: hypothetical protein WC803_01180 [Sphingomonas sp.]|jgi:putative Ca2+/H+ antiporter (TMEM165/GDT1 family)
MAAFVAALLVQLTDRTMWRAAMTGDRFSDKAEVVAGMALGLALGNGAASFGGVLIGAELTPEASALLLAIALASAGIGAVMPVKMPGTRLINARLGAFGAGLVGTLALALTDRTQFVTAALAARTTLPILAPTGAVLGSLAVIIPAIFIGERALGTWRLAVVRPIIGGVLLLASAITGLGALRLL